MRKKKQIEINIVGKANTGKTTLAWILYKFLTSHEIEAEINDPDYPDISVLEKQIEDVTITQRLNEIKNCY